MIDDKVRLAYIKKLAKKMKDGGKAVKFTFDDEFKYAYWKSLIEDNNKILNKMNYPNKQLHMDYLAKFNFGKMVSFENELLSVKTLSSEDKLTKLLMIDQSFNKDFQATEIDTISKMAESCQYQADNNDKSSFIYNTQRDSAVRDEHAALEGYTALQSDPIWDDIIPPNGYNCRCYITATNAKPSNHKLLEMVIMNKKESDEVDKTFRYNPAKEKYILPKNHPYIMEMLNGDYEKEFKKFVKKRNLE